MSAVADSGVRAAGAVLWRRAPSGGILVALIHRPRYGDWSLPKGKLDSGETAPVAAVREIAEETGFSAVLGRFLTRVHYTVPAAVLDGANGRFGKSVDYFSARAVTGRFQVNSEVDELRWLPPNDACAAASYPDDVDVLNRFLALPAETSTLMLVRHAKAGSKEEFSGDDDLRPLSEAGTRQAAALSVMLRAFAPDRVLAAPRLRCVQTVRGLAEDLETEVGHEPLLSEEGFAQDPELAVRRLRTIAAVGSPAVCSQGAVIPYLVHTLATRDGVDLPATKNSTSARRPVACKKGSVWLLSFAPGQPSANGDPLPRLVAADYFPSALPTPATIG